MRYREKATFGVLKLRFETRLWRRRVGVGFNPRRHESSSEQWLNFQRVARSREAVSAVNSTVSRTVATWDALSTRVRPCDPRRFAPATQGLHSAGTPVHPESHSPPTIARVTPHTLPSTLQCDPWNSLHLIQAQAMEDTKASAYTRRKKNAIEHQNTEHSTSYVQEYKSTRDV